MIILKYGEIDIVISRKIGGPWTGIVRIHLAASLGIPLAHARVLRGEVAFLVDEDVPLRAIGLGETVSDDADDDLIGHQRAALHTGLRLFAQLASRRDGGAKDVAGGDGGDVQLTGKNGRLCALPCAGSTQ